jgi:hypothetical protein
MAVDPKLGAAQAEAYKIMRSGTDTYEGDIARAEMLLRNDWIIESGHSDRLAAKLEEQQSGRIVDGRREFSRPIKAQIDRYLNCFS